MHSSEIVPRKVQGQGCFEVIQLLGDGICHDVVATGGLRWPEAITGAFFDLSP